VAEADGQQHIRHVIGPDSTTRMDDNAFTNMMACWNIARGLETMDLLRERWPDHAAASESWRLRRRRLARRDRAHRDWL
jgi:trehalose/maltose hydrolase-like predicted phosphorylase